MQRPDVAKGVASRSGVPKSAVLVGICIAAIAGTSCREPVQSMTSPAPITSGVSPAPVLAYTISFADLPANGSAVTTYVESGFTVTIAAASWLSITTYGNPAPSLQFRSNEGVTTEAELRITASGSLFSFTSIDLYSSTTPIPYRIVGQRQSADAFNQAATVPNTFGGFATVASAQPDAAIDTLIIRLTNAAAPCCRNPMGVDTIALTR